jgi:general secretion pathway protein J
MKRRDAGFTLLEMLVAIVVFGLVMAGLAQTFRFGLTAWSDTTRRTAGPENLAAMDAALTKMIEQAQPGSLAGHPDGLIFTTRLPAGAGINGLADVAVLAGPGDALIMRYRQHPPGVVLTAPPTAQIEILAQNVAGLSVTYLAGQSNKPPVWVSKWSNPGLPLLIRLHLVMTDGETWPDLVAAPGPAGG